MNPISRRTFILAAGAAALWSATGLPAHASGETLELWKTPWCGCCTAWVDHMREAGFEVRVTEMEDLEPLTTRLGVTPELA
ncbi:twin-arginine translocation signal domain-containing protein, partial [Parvibaculum sp.]|uniref:twin-arginine translocation signal domain-containing protein n=1 Tax=Parvibaculum sp. TaxID=2024848 RepID=UPI0032EF3ED8